MTDTHRCARGNRCPGAEKIEVCDCVCHLGPHYDCSPEFADGGCGHQHSYREVGARIEPARGLCPSCAVTVSSQLGDLPADYVECHFLLGSGGAALADVLVRSTRELPVPISLSVESLQASMVHEASFWATMLAERLGITWSMDHQRPGALLQRSIRLLVNAFGTFVTLPEHAYRHHSTGNWRCQDGLSGALELAHFHGLTRFIAGRTKLVHRLPAPCPRCETMSLVRYNGEDVVLCQNCPPAERAVWTEDDYRRLCLILAEDIRSDVA